MARVSRTLLTALHVLFISGVLIAQTTQSKKGPKLVGPQKWTPSAQEVTTAYWTLEPGWNTTLEMRNNVFHHELTVTPVLRTTGGQETPLAPITIAPDHVVSLNLRKSAAANSANLGSFGSVAFRFDGLSADNLFAATIVRREGEPIDFHFDGQQAGPTFISGGIEGMWWVPAASSKDYLILSNPLKKTVTGTLSLSSTFASHRPIALSLGPGETKRIDLGEMLGQSSIGSVGGLSISLPDKELISATQIVFDEVTGLAAIMKMFDREPNDQAKNRLLRAPMMALSQPDQGLGFPNGTQLVPRIFLRNANSVPVQVSPSIDWRNQDSGTFALPTLTLAPGEVKTISLADYQQAGKIPADATWGTMKLAYAGRSADLVAVAVSYDKNNRYGLQTPFSENLSHLWVGGMWHVNPTHNTFITTGNAGPEPTTAQVTLFYNGGKSKYRMEKMLSPGQQLWLDVAHLVHDQVPDSDGHTLPPDTMTGSYELEDLDHGYVGQLYEGKLIIDKTFGHAAYGCGSCCGYDAVQFNPNSFVGPVDIDGGETIDANSTCTGGLVDVTGDANDWGSSDTSVATLASAMLHTVAVGTATGSAEAELEWAHPPSCPNEYWEPDQSINVTPEIQTISPALGLVGTAISVTISGSGFAQGDTIQAGPSITVSSISVASSTKITATFTIENSSDAGGSWNVTVSSPGGQTSNTKTFFAQIPTSLSVLSDSSIANGANGGCQSTDYGIHIDVKYQAMDQNKTAIQSASMIPQESVNGSGWADVGPNAVMTTEYTNSNGTYDDAPLGICASASFSNTAVTQAVRIAVGSQSYSVRTNNLTISGPSQGHGSISNGSDINVTR